jgi:hypothetical protein
MGGGLFKALVETCGFSFRGDWRDPSLPPVISAAIRHWRKIRSDCFVPNGCAGNVVNLYRTLLANLDDAKLEDFDVLYIGEWDEDSRPRQSPMIFFNSVKRWTVHNLGFLSGTFTYGSVFFDYHVVLHYRGYILDLTASHTGVFSAQEYVKANFTSEQIPNVLSNPEEVPIYIVSAADYDRLVTAYGDKEENLPQFGAGIRNSATRLFASELPAWSDQRR